MIARGRARCPEAEFTVGALGSVEFPAGAFEVITLWDVLEHVASPLEALQQVRAWLVPRGGLCLSVPNGESLFARLMGKRWVLLLREHLWYFAPDTMRRLLSEAGFEVLEIRSKSVRFSLGNIARRLAQHSGKAPEIAGRFSRCRASRLLSLRFPIGEMDVVARVKS
jgi:hypothetical protein